MYTIPLFLLTKETNILSKSDIQEHQNFCKLFSMAQASYEKKLQDSKSKKCNNIQKSEKDLLSNVWSWFDNLSFEDKLKICTIKNNWVLRILIQLSFFYFLDNKTTFKPIDEMNIAFTSNQNYSFLYDNICIYNTCIKKKKFFSGYNEDDYYNFYFEMKRPEYRIKKKNIIKEEIDYENKLINNIILFSLEKEDTLDALSLHEDLLKDSKTLKQILNFFSGKECFKEMLYPVKYNNSYNFCFPTWMHGKNEFSLCQIISGIFEQQILIAYEYFLYSKKMFFFPKTDLLMDIYKEKENLENFLIYRDKNKEKILTLETISEMINKIKTNVDFKKRKSNLKKLFDQLCTEYYQTSFYIGEPPLEGKEEIYKDIINEMNKNKTKGKEIHSLLNKITFMKLRDINKYREFIFFNLKKYFTEIRNKEFLEDLYNNNSNDNSNEHKPGKKKKKKKKKNKNANINNININNKEEEKITINENNIEKNFSSNDENENNIDNNNNTNYSCSSNSLKLKEEKNIKENKGNHKKNKIKEEKIKTKEFFLFPTNNKKNKDKIKNNETISNNQSLSEKNNIKINYFDKKEETNININKENKFINNKSKSKKDIQDFSEESINRLEIINNKENEENKENLKKMENNNYYINSPETITSFSLEASDKDKGLKFKEISDKINEKKENNTNNINENKNQINMTINIINNQYIYQQYPFFNFNFDNLALMQSQFFYYYHVPSDYFFETLTKEIKLYEDFTTKNVLILDKIRSKYFTNVEKIIKSGLNKKYEIKFGHYGSFFTNLSIEGSDVDILVYYKPLLPNLDFLEDIINLLDEHKEEFESINPRLSASVPVIVLQINISKEIDNEILKFLPYFENKDISHINIDLTFTSNEKEFKRPEQIVNYINTKLKEYEEIRPLLLLIKRYFRVMKMNKSFTGGLSSFSLFLLILAFLKNQEKEMNLGKYLYYIMEKYSFFEFKNFGIDVEGKETYFPLNNNDFNSSELNNQKIDNIGNIYENNRVEEIKIIDPLTKFNVAKSSFKLYEIKNTFNKALYFFKYESLKFQNDNQEENKSINEDFLIIKKLFSIK